MDFDKLFPVSERAVEALIKHEKKSFEKEENAVSLIESDPADKAIWLICGLDKVKDSHPGVPVKMYVASFFIL